MANRVLIGNKSASNSPGTNYGYGMYVSKAGKDVLTCGRKDLLFDSSQGTGASGFEYAGGQQSSLSSSGQNFLTTGSKDGLGYIPLVIHMEDMMQNHNWATAGGSQTKEWYATRTDILKTTASTIYPARFGPLSTESPSNSNFVAVGRRTASADVGLGSSQACTNLAFMVLKIPLAYGYMNSTYFEETD